MSLLYVLVIAACILQVHCKTGRYGKYDEQDDYAKSNQSIKGKWRFTVWRLFQHLFFLQ